MMLPNLLCEENKSWLQEIHDDFCSVSESDCEFIEILFERERVFRSNNVNSVWFESLRLDAVKWILQKRALFGYHYYTAYLSMIYLDRYLSRMQISDAKQLKIQILSIACLSLAAKMEECEARPWRDYTVEGNQILESSIKRMEVLVLKAMEWKMDCATPFSFSNYFAAKFCGEKCSERKLIVRAHELILASMEEIDVAKYRSSVIAAAAVLAACDARLTKTMLESKIDVVPSWGSLEKESIVACYSLLQRVLEPKTPKSIFLDNPMTPNDVGDSTNISRGTMRRRLSFDSWEGVCPLKKTSKDRLRNNFDEDEDENETMFF